MVGDFRAALHELPWHGTVCGFSDLADVLVPANFLSYDWLSDFHETFLLEILRSRIISTEMFHSEHDIATIWTSKKIRIAYEQRKAKEYLPSARAEIVQLGLALASGKKKRLLE